MLDPLVLVLPGLIAFHLYQDLPKADMAYPTLVNNVLPVPMVGFFGAVLFGAVISTFNGFLNSASVDSICQCNTPFNYLFRCFELQCLSRSVV